MYYTILLLTYYLTLNYSYIPRFLQLQKPSCPRSYVLTYVLTFLFQQKVSCFVYRISQLFTIFVGK